MKQTSKRAAIFSGTITAIIISVFSLAYITANAANRFTFTGRGVVTETNNRDKTLTIDFTQMSQSAAPLVQDGLTTVRVNQASIFKPNTAGKQIRIKSSNIVAGNEVTVTGVVRSDNTFVARKVVVNPRSFRIKGKILSIDDTKKEISILIGSSNFKPEKYVNKTITVYYNDNTVFMHLGKTKDSDEIEAKYQRIQIEGNIINVDTFEATKVFDPI